MALRFLARGPVQWTGRYRRIPGKQSVLHVRWDDRVDLIWQDGPDSCSCLAEMTNDLANLARAVNDVKRRYTGQPGGSFVINEYGQVISPVADGSSVRFYVGDCGGSIVFTGPDRKRFTLDGDAGLAPGADWDLPYVGIPYNLSWDNTIYFPSKEGCDTERQLPLRQDPNLILAIRRVRRSGGVKFIVNPHGVVLTKFEAGPFNWQPKYVGRINYEYWFVKQSP